jgi:thiamine kinase-like enzyme
MSTPLSLQVTAFEGDRCIASGSLASVAEKIKEVIARGEVAPVLVFDDQTGAQIDLNPRTLGEATSPITAEPLESRNAGRPRLGVVAREVTLLPRQWEWLGQQQGGASATLRKLVDQARRENAGEEKIRAAREALYRFMTAIAGDAPGYEEALRALFVGDVQRFSIPTSNWATDVRKHIGKLAPAAFGYAPSPLDAVIPLTKREAVLRAFGTSEIQAIERITNGASGAGVFKVTANQTEYILRIEGQPDGLRDPARQYACLKIAADAGVAPRLIYADVNAGVAVTDFIVPDPTSVERSKAKSLRMIVKAVRDLHDAPLFPGLVDYLEGVDMLIRRCIETGILAKRAIEKHLKFYGELAAAYPRKNQDLVSSHNDLNPGNVLFQKERVWLVDWESAFAADRYVDLAAIANFFTTEESEKELVLQNYFGAALNDLHRARFFLMQQANRMFYAMVVLNFVAAAAPATKLTAADMKGIRWSEVRGEMAGINTNETKVRFASALLNETLLAFQSPRFNQAIALVKGNNSR